MPEDENALFKAIIGNNIGEVQRLLENGINIEARDKWGWTPLMAAAVWDNAEIAELLIKKDADVNAKAEYMICDLDIGHPLCSDHMACVRKDQNMCWHTPLSLSRPLFNLTEDNLMESLLLKHGAKAYHKCGDKEYYYTTASWFTIGERRWS